MVFSVKASQSAKKVIAFHTLLGARCGFCFAVHVMLRDVGASYKGR